MIYISNISTESDVNIRLVKAQNTTNMLSIIWKSDRIKQDFFFFFFFFKFQNIFKHFL